VRRARDAGASRRGIHKNVKYWIRPNIENRIKSAEIPAFFQSRLVEILPDSVRIETPDGERALRNDFVFAMTGYHPDIGFLEAHGIRFDPESRRPYTNPESLESDRKGVYLAGVPGGRDAHQRDFHRERALPWKDHRRGDSFGNLSAIRASVI
jgi:thioredoxin reductase